MQEIWIPEFFVVLFLLLALIRPLVKGIRSLAGISWLPVLAFFIAVGIFPAYGFRPEFIPLLIFSAIAAFKFIPHLFSIRGGADFEDFFWTEFFYSTTGIVILVLAALPAFAFSPREDEGNTGPDYSFTLADEQEGRVFDISVYSGLNEGEKNSGPMPPLLLVSPPVFGEPALDGVCRELGGLGFTVLAYKSRGMVSPAEWVRRWRAFSAGTRSAAANGYGRTLEAIREKEIVFLLDQIGKDPTVDRGISLSDLAARERIFLAAYDYGASALALLAGNPAFAPARPEVRGVIAVESPLWFLYREEDRQYRELPAGAGWFKSVWTGIGNWFASLKPRKITGLGEIPAANIPVLFLVSDRAFDTKSRDGRYGAVFAFLGAAKKPSALAAVPGAGPLDYAGFPVKYPLLSRFWAGREKRLWQAGEAAGGTARIIANFAGLLLNGEEGVLPPAVGHLPPELYIEYAAWDLPGLRGL
jgi:hypothetical protein